MLSFPYNDSHHKDKTASLPSYLYHRNHKHRKVVELLLLYDSSI